MFYLDLGPCKNYYIREYLIEDIVAVFILPIEAINLIIKLNDLNKYQNLHNKKKIEEMYEYL
jgi:hypothetical protein